ncbi:MAG: MOSC N-terminal beta barrel domain-containing protein [Planctomycetaceae bacterium]|nr:MOSC N-terminal beta barrel domain-containing protein [Planctomycetaceae bacterium]
MPYLSRIAIYPVKSLNPVYVDEVNVLPSGALENDRRWALVDEEGKFVNGKREPKIHQLHMEYRDSDSFIFHSPIGEYHFDLDEIYEDPEFSDHYWQEVKSYLAKFFGYPVTLRSYPAKGLPDDPELGGPTLVSKASLETVSEWFGGLPYEETWLRFRANLEIEDAPPFWEDQLFTADPQQGVLFQIGRVPFLGMNPCARCVVPTRDPHTGETIEGFAKTFRTQREQSRPEWAEERRFDHYFRLALNTILNTEYLMAPTTIYPRLILKVGDEITIPSA